ncbi:IS200/IS605 family transposase [Aquisalimonas sp. 2447]|uniref:IS200/IS605 family transposase n=1 Tax=Aquisalimonas sp. 2447 TaxID=2740807 RepID=UPI0014327496|nr:IS200/IS605 family transposase [Aquisalimonas sp. 2447]QIT55879.1 IS200/IS605 family transposase [Aquisalimonas sp. 2447]
MKHKTTLRTRSHGAFRLHYHIVFVIRYCNPVMNAAMIERLQEIFADVLSKWGCSLTECNGEADHVHLLIEAHPALDLSRLIGNLKTVSARRMRQEFAQRLARWFWKPYFWSRAYAVTTTGGANLDTVKQYVLSQESPP